MQVSLDNVALQLSIQTFKIADQHAQQTAAALLQAQTSPQAGGAPSRPLDPNLGSRLNLLA